jgi:hypothetical protein
MKPARILATLLFLAISQMADAESSATVKQLLLMAIDAPDGKAHGVLNDPVADRFRQATGLTLPVLVEVSTLKHFRQEGCRRLNLRIRQEGSGKGQFGIDYGINLCRDGSPPTEGIDLDVASRVLAR